jgi:hypothetical protein
VQQDATIQDKQIIILDWKIIQHNKANLPIKEMAPHTAQMTRHSPTDPDRSSAIDGDTKIPDPANITIFEPHRSFRHNYLSQRQYQGIPSVQEILLLSALIILMYYIWSSPHKH